MGLEGIVNCACLYAHGGILYEMIYWSNGDRKTVWVNEQEITSNQVRNIGFK
jgi:hypothetical protein